MDNVKQLKAANLDQYQMDNATFDVDKSAWRVSVVDGVTVNIDNLTVSPGQISGESKITTINIPEIIKQTEIQQISIPTIIKEYEKIEVPVVIKEIEYKIVEVPVIVPEIRIVEIEKPVILKETEYKEFPMFVKVCIVIQAIALVGLLITNILKG